MLREDMTQVGSHRIGSRWRRRLKPGKQRLDKEKSTSPPKNQKGNQDPWKIATNKACSPTIRETTVAERKEGLEPVKKQERVIFGIRLCWYGLPMLTSDFLFEKGESAKDELQK